MPTNEIDDLDTLKALNVMATYLGIPPLTALIEATSHPDFVIAQNILNDVTTTILSQGLPCNTDYNYPLTEVDGSGYVVIPPGALICSIGSYDYVERDGLVYNRQSREFTTNTSLKADIVWNQTFDNLPHLVRQWITIESSRALVGRLKGDAALAQLTIPEATRVKQEFQRYVYSMEHTSTLLDDNNFNIAIRGRNRRPYHTI
jgi:hypothetical protein